MVLALFPAGQNQPYRAGWDQTVVVKAVGSDSDVEIALFWLQSVQTAISSSKWRTSSLHGISHSVEDLLSHMRSSSTAMSGASQR